MTSQQAKKKTNPVVDHYPETNKFQRESFTQQSREPPPSIETSMLRLTAVSMKITTLEELHLDHVLPPSNHREPTENHHQASSAHQSHLNNNSPLSLTATKSYINTISSIESSLQMLRLLSFLRNLQWKAVGT